MEENINKALIQFNKVFEFIMVSQIVKGKFVLGAKYLMKPNSGYRSPTFQASLSVSSRHKFCRTQFGEC